MSADQWIQLKNAIPAARKRTADLSRDPPKNVTLSHKAWRIIADLARRDDVTLSALIEDRLGKEWGKL
jgi:macrodomain Ter protein organizer (MatP/YcbG family)